MKDARAAFAGEPDDAVAGRDETKKAFFPETAAAGYSRVDGMVSFYGRINALLTSDATVLDFGAGRGRGQLDDHVPWRSSLQKLRGKCAKVIGVDVDSAIMEHPGLDEFHLIRENERLPLADSSVDLIVSDAVFEHVANPEFVSAELARVLKPDGWLCARTPNRWGYIGLGTNLVPNRLHVSLLRYLQPHRKPEDVFPTVYAMNTKAALRRYFPTSQWEHCSYGHFAEPAYFGKSRLLWFLVLMSYRLTPESLAPMWLIFLRKRG
ncbi:class I SAM-dependent methyltransferase [Algiphilus sp.]|uniref:class I SAM-dependent methyltransferase n=1 Tax=Algiphilus sp. TaxID=1872431 RepID=UPI003C7A4537